MTERATPHVTAYLAALPRGADSYPDHVAKASLLRQAIAEVDVAELAAAVPPTIAALVRNPPPVSSWVPDAQLNAVLLAILDVPCRGDEKRFLEHARAGNRKILSSPLYRALFLVASPERVLRGITSRWGALRRGVELKMLTLSEGHGEFAMEFPPKLMTTDIAKVRAVSFEVTLELAGAKDVHVAVREVTDTRAVFEGRWR